MLPVEEVRRQPTSSDSSLQHDKEKLRHFGYSPSQESHPPKKPRGTTSLFLMLSVFVLLLFVVLFLWFHPFSHSTTDAAQSIVEAGYAMSNKQFGKVCPRGFGRIPIRNPNHKRVPSFDAGSNIAFTKKLFYKQFVVPSKPVVIKNALRSLWPRAFLYWQEDDYLRKRVGPSLPINVESSKNNKFGYAQSDWKRHDMPFSQFLDIYKTLYKDQIWYMSNDIPDGLKEDIRMFPFVPCQTFPYRTEFGMWFGNGGQNSLLHNDENDNLLAMVDGYKRFILYPPEDGPFLYEDKKYVARVSPVNLDAPNTSLYPNLKKVHDVYEVVVEPGDILFVPRFWFHQVESSCRHLALNFWFDFHSFEILHAKVGHATFTSLSSHQVAQSLRRYPSLCAKLNKWRHLTPFEMSTDPSHHGL